MTEFQRSIFRLLEELDDICRRHGIVYYLIGGSALGALRHGGFIPWDDDADIVLTRDNWEKLKAALLADMPEDRALVSWETHDEEPSVFFRYVNTEQCSIHLSLWDHVMPWGCIVDIFVLNPLPEDPAEWPDYHMVMRRFGDFLMDSYFLMNSETPLFWICWDRLRGLFLGADRVRRDLYGRLSRHDEAACTHYSYLYARLHIVYPKEIFQEPRYVPFEGRLMPVPTLAEEHFRILFGDNWYEIPEKTDIIRHEAHHDAHRSYREYMADYLIWTDRAALKRRYRLLRLVKILRSRILRRTDAALADRRAEYLSEAFSEHCRQTMDWQRNWLEKKEYFKLFTFFQPFFDEQLQLVRLKSGRAVAIPQDSLAAALRALIHAGFSRRAETVMQSQSAAARQMPDVWRELQTLLRDKRKLFLAAEGGDSSAFSLAENLFARFPWDRDIRRIWLQASLKALAQGAAGPADISAADRVMLRRLLEEARTGERQWPCSSEFAKIGADILERLGRHGEASEIYWKLAETSRDGMVLQQIRSEKGIRRRREWEEQ